MPQCQFPVFCCFCVLEKLHRKYSRNWRKQKPNLLFLPKLREDRRWHGEGPEAGHTTGGARPSPWPRLPMVSPPGPPPDDAPSPIKSPRWKKPKGHIAFPRNILQATTVIESRSGGSRSSFRHPAREGNPYQRPSTPPWSPPERCVSSLPWTMGP
jgi:hypothetical protein